MGSLRFLLPWSCRVWWQSQKWTALIPFPIWFLRFNEFLQAQKLDRWQREKAAAPLQPLVLGTETRAEIFASHGSGFAPGKTDKLTGSWVFFCLFSCKVEELEDKV